MNEPVVSATRTGRLLMSTAAFVIIVAGLRASSGIVAPLLLAVSLTIVFHPLRAVFERRLPSWAASVMVLVLAYVLLIGLTLALVVAMGRLAALIPTYASDIDDFAAQVGDGLGSLGVADPEAAALTDELNLERVLDTTLSFLSGVVSVLSNLLFVLMLLVFLAFDAAKVGRLAADAHQHRPHLVDALGSFARGTRSYLAVSAIFGLIVAIVDTAMLWALDIPEPFVWGVLAFVTNFIPNIGFVIGVIPPALIGLLESGPGLMLLVIVLYSAVNLVIQSIIQPRFVAQAVGLSTTLTFLSLVFWAWILGPLGALLAIPMSLLVKAVLVDADPDSAWRGPLISGQPTHPNGAGP